MAKRVLIAEDSSVIQNLTKKILMQLNYSIDAVKNGVDVLKKLEADSYDIILMDINMPKMNGMDCAKAIRELEDKVKSEIPIVAITGNAGNYSEVDFEKKCDIRFLVPEKIEFSLLKLASIILLEFLVNKRYSP